MLKVPINDAFAVAPMNMFVRLARVRNESANYLTCTRVDDFLSSPLRQAGNEPMLVFLVRQNYGCGNRQIGLADDPSGLGSVSFGAGDFIRLFEIRIEQNDEQIK